MIPARMGSQRLKKKNLRELQGVPLLARAIRKAVAAACFDAVWVNAEHPDFAAIAAAEGVQFHKRPEALASNTATSEDFVREFLAAHPCDYVVQVHSIAPLLTAAQTAAFVDAMLQSGKDVFLSVVNEQIECAINGNPVNFRFDCKTNSQELDPVQRITWSITGWRAAPYLAAYDAGKCATYAGDVGYYVIDRAAGHIIKTEDDLRFAQAYLDAFPERGI
jgi:CMP-N-acetylneuraminic acid synthetase